MSAPVLDVTRTPDEVLADAALAYADAESEEDFVRARQRLQKAAERFAIRASIRNRGGRPKKLTLEVVLNVMSRVGSVRDAALELRVGRATLYRYLSARKSQKK